MSTTTETTEATPTLVALDVSAFVDSTDSAEVAALKRKVKTVAKKYTDRHGWCDEVKRALVEIGIREPTPVRVNLTLHPLLGGAVVPVKIDPSLLAGKTAEQQRTVLATMLSDLRAYQSSTRGGAYTATLTATPDVIVGMVLSDPTAPTAVEWKRISNEGRVLHAVIDADPTTRWVTSLCERASEYRRAVPLTNGSVTAHCQSCTRKLGQ